MVGIDTRRTFSYFAEGSLKLFKLLGNQFRRMYKEPLTDSLSSRLFIRVYFTIVKICNKYNYLAVGRIIKCMIIYYFGLYIRYIC